ncbi:MAG: SDR family NAD(P)-dependent oxidoreductase [Rikenellaceae bacterium]|nr:SDR family NAD(P)-dependent oxidoreductase [Rikenellaceae bacterium]
MTPNDNRWALVTGGSSGIGRCYAEQLAEMGYNIITVSNNQEQNQEVAEQIKRTSAVRVVALYKDLSDPKSAEELHEYCTNEGLEVEVLINNAGILLFDILDRTSDKTINTAIGLHVHTPTLLCKLFGRDMCRRGRGHILIMSSATVRLAYPTIAVYNATKSYLRNFAASLWFELRHHGVSVTTVYPGAIDTPLYSLEDKYRRPLRALGVMMAPEKLARKALRRMFRRRKNYTPGLFTKIVVRIAPIIPDRVILWVMRHPKLRHLF